MPSPSSQTRLFLINLINHGVELFLDNAFLNRIEKNLLTKEEWHTFAVQRYLSATPFEDLLEACEAAARRDGLVDLAEVIESNLRDERGIDAEGTRHEHLSHSTWRKNFYQAIGISELELTSTTPSVATKEYQETVRGLVKTDDPLIMAGGLLVLEAIIPREFAKLKSGRDQMFPNLSDEAKLYIDDHIVHDAKAHYPDLLAALSDLANSETVRTRIASGINLMVEVKKRFYERLQQSHS